MSIIIRVHPQYGRVGTDGLNTQQRDFLRRSRRAVARQTYYANAGLSAALRQANLQQQALSIASARSYGAYGASQAMVGAYSSPYYSSPLYSTPAYTTPLYAGYSPFGPGFPFNNAFAAPALAYTAAYAPYYL